MNEAKWSRKWMNKLKAAVKARGGKPVIFRHVTLYVSGIPDYSITVGHVTVWLEFKKWPGGRIASHQQAVLRRLTYGFVVWLGHPTDEVALFKKVRGILLDAITARHQSHPIVGRVKRVKR